MGRTSITIGHKQCRAVSLQVSKKIKDTAGSKAIVATSKVDSRKKRQVEGSKEERGTPLVKKAMPFEDFAKKTGDFRVSSGASKSICQTFWQS